jgi:UDP-N-acetylmuramate dehydrogenase
MLLRPGDPDCMSAGSFFKNPVVTLEMLSHIEQVARAQHLMGIDENAPRFPAGDGKVKLPAAWLIERAGFQKGHERGRVGISSKHTLAIINRGEATACELMELAEEIRGTVQKKFGLSLQMEPVMVGFPPSITG